MKTVLLMAKIYTEGSKNIGGLIVQNYLKVFAWFSFIMFELVLYAIVCRLATGFSFYRTKRQWPRPMSFQVFVWGQQISRL
ncbi:MAG: hypothetical protein RIB64_14925 [Arenibacter algicola]